MEVVLRFEVRASALRVAACAKYRESPSALQRVESAEFAARFGHRTVIGRNYHRGVPIYEFACQSCGHRFEELIGSHVGRSENDVSCPACGERRIERLFSSSYAPIHRQMTAAEKRRLEAKRGTDRGGAKERFRKQRAAERRAGARRGGRGPRRPA
ncbi:MAG TPA: zinc ribbon domain-containing protein [Solirubrobacterales bacterium]|nr:zinc ribbon domain-containing protein [Solirubrobacterales bacterium]HEU4979751.1 zinc ribbon domain-containing protein [Solirubrobacterales bacterium]